MALRFGDIPYTGLAHDRVTLPWPQDPRNNRQIHPMHGHAPASTPDNPSPVLTNPYQSPAHPPNFPTRPPGPPTISPDILRAESIAPFFLRSYHTRDLSATSARSLRLHELRRTITTLRLLGYGLQPRTPLTDELGFDAPSLTFFHHFTEPNERMMGVIGTANLVVDNLKWCLREETADPRVKEWKDAVFWGGWKVVHALEALLRRYD